MNYQQAEQFAREMLRTGDIIAYAAGYTHERGRYIEVETDQGWNPDPIWQEIPAPYNPHFDL